MVTGWVLAFRAGARFGGFRRGKNAVRNFDLGDSDSLVLARCRNGNVTFWPPVLPVPDATEQSNSSPKKMRDDSKILNDMQPREM